MWYHLRMAAIHLLEAACGCDDTWTLADTGYRQDHTCTICGAKMHIIGEAGELGKYWDNGR